MNPIRKPKTKWCATCGVVCQSVRYVDGWYECIHCRNRQLPFDKSKEKAA